MRFSGLLEEFSDQLRGAERVWVAFSGGLDSTLLLHACVEFLGAEKLGALHLDHQLQEGSDQWLTHCQKEAEKLGVELRYRKLNVINQGEGIESEARRQRYQFFSENIASGELLLLGHHGDDQAETFLYRLFRGSGARGLSGMPQERKLANSNILRPLLAFPKKHLEELAKSAHLTWIEDPSNSDDRFDRNYIRNQVIPVIQDRWPSMQSRILKAANNLTAASKLLDEYAHILAAQCGLRSERLGQSIDIQSFSSFSEETKDLLLSFLLRQQNLLGYDSSCLAKVEALLLSGEDKEPILSLSGAEIRRYAGRLFIMRALLPNSFANYNCDWNGKEAIKISGCGHLKFDKAYSGSQLIVGFRQGGERCKPLERNKSQSLKKLFQEYNLEPWLRDRTPLLWQGDQLVAVAGLFSCAEAIPIPSISWQVISENKQEN